MIAAWEVRYFARNVVAELCAVVMRRTGFRFSKGYRHEVTPRHALVYRLCNTVRANYRADGKSFPLL